MAAELGWELIPPLDGPLRRLYIDIFSVKKEKLAIDQTLTLISVIYLLHLLIHFWLYLPSSSHVPGSIYAVPHLRLWLAVHNLWCKIEKRHKTKIKEL